MENEIFFCYFMISFILFERIMSNEMNFEYLIKWFLFILDNVLVGMV